MSKKGQTRRSSGRGRGRPRKEPRVLQAGRDPFEQAIKDVMFGRIPIGDVLRRYAPMLGISERTLERRIADEAGPRYKENVVSGALQKLADRDRERQNERLMELKRLAEAHAPCKKGRS